MTPRKPKRAKQLGISDADYERLLAAQGGHCALCPNRPKTRRLHVDHDHATGRVRGLLCYVCNRSLPASRDAQWHRDAAAYLDEHADTEPPRPSMTELNRAAKMGYGLEGMRGTRFNPGDGTKADHP